MKNKTIIMAACLSFATLISCNGQKGGGDVSMKTKADSVAYAIGTSIGGSMKKDGLDSLNLDILKAGLNASLRGDSLLIDQGKAQIVIQSYLQDRQKAKQSAEAEASKGNIEIGKKFLAENKTKPGVIELPSGLQYQIIKEGKGPKPVATDTVVVHYHGTLIDGTIFNSSVDRGEPTTYPANGFIPGWIEALQMMPAGSKWKLFIPANLAYGDQSRGPKLPANSTLIFDLELLSVKGK